MIDHLPVIPFRRLPCIECGQPSLTAVCQACAYPFREAIDSQRQLRNRAAERVTSPIREGHPICSSGRRVKTKEVET